MSLIKRVKSHANGQKTSGQNTLALFVECVDHGVEHNEFTPLVALISLSESAQSRMAKVLSGQVLQGYRFTKSPKSDYGHKFAALKDKNQGVDNAALSRLRGFVEQKKSIQSQEVKEFAKVDKPKPEFDLDAWAKRQIKAHPGMAASMAAALQRAEREQSISH